MYTGHGGAVVAGIDIIISHVIRDECTACSLACSLQSRCCTRGVTGRDRPHRARSSRPIVRDSWRRELIHERQRMLNNDEPPWARARRSRLHSRRYPCGGGNRECDLEIARHKAEKGVRPSLCSPGLAVIRAFEYLFAWTNAGHMPGVHDRIICSAPSSHRVVPCHVIPWAQWNPLFSFRFNAPAPVLVGVTANVPSTSFSSFSLRSDSLSQPSPSRFSFPLSRTSPSPRIFSPFCVSRKRASVTSIFLRSRVDGFGRVKEPPLPLSTALLFCPACGGTLHDCDHCSFNGGLRVKSSGIILFVARISESLVYKVYQYELPDHINLN